MTHLQRTPFGRTSSAADVTEGVDLAGQRAVVTGANSGIGLETARALAVAGAEVTLAVRRPDAGSAVATELREQMSGEAVHVARLDLGDLGSVTAFARAWRGPLHILVCNAGIMALPELDRGTRGQEQQFATNYLGHFALALALYPALAEAGGARVVSVSSSGHLFSPVVFDDLAYRFRPYDPLTAYGQSKTAQVLFAVEADRRWAGSGIRVNALHPGAVATNLQKHTGGLKTPEPYRKTPIQGAATPVFLAASPLAQGIGARYFEDVNEAPVVTERPATFGVPGVAPYALDADNAARLWATATELLR